MSLSSPNIILIGLTFQNNSATLGGGLMTEYSQSCPKFDSCTFK